MDIYGEFLKSQVKICCCYILIHFQQNLIHCITYIDTERKRERERVTGGWLAKLLAGWKCWMLEWKIKQCQRFFWFFFLDFHWYRFRFSHLSSLFFVSFPQPAAEETNGKKKRKDNIHPRSDSWMRLCEGEKFFTLITIPKSSITNIRQSIKRSIAGKFISIFLNFFRWKI
jgi:hypothetical protein